MRFTPVVGAAAAAAGWSLATPASAFHSFRRLAAVSLAAPPLFLIELTVFPRPELERLVTDIGIFLSRSSIWVMRASELDAAACTSHSSTRFNASLSEKLLSRLAGVACSDMIITSNVPSVDAPMASADGSARRDISLLIWLLPAIASLWSVRSPSAKMKLVMMGRRAGAFSLHGRHGEPCERTGREKGQKTEPPE